VRRLPEEYSPKLEMMIICPEGIKVVVFVRMRPNVNWMDAAHLGKLF
jgi:hypothetical protein